MNTLKYIRFCWVFLLINVFVFNTIQAQDNTTCSTATSLVNGVTCDTLNKPNTINTEFDATHTASCIVDGFGSLWYQYSPTSTTTLAIKTNAAFNDNVSIFSGTTCGNMVEVSCVDADEFGFTGEVVYVPITAGNTCYIRISGSQADFGKCAGEICIELEEVSSSPTAPNNDNCSNAITLGIDQTCVNGTNTNATIQAPIPSQYEFARADVWYKFTATADTNYVINSQADFAQIITLYSGNCGSLTELASTDERLELITPNLINGQNYYIQISGVFATVEGNFCIDIEASNIPPICTNPPCGPPGECTGVNIVLANDVDDYIAGDVEVHKAANTITADNILVSLSDIKYIAETRILLKPGFKAILGTAFHAYIDDCDGIDNTPDYVDPTDPEADCGATDLDIETPTEDYISNETITRRATNSITADNTIDAGSNITYLAGNSITLTPGFTVQAGAEFLADIEACYNTNTLVTEEEILAFQQNNTTEEQVLANQQKAVKEAYTTSDSSNDVNKEIEKTDSAINKSPFERSKLDGITQFKVAPNPFANTTLFYYELANKEAKAELYLFDILGRILEQSTLTEVVGNKEIGKGLEAGIYFVQMRVGGKSSRVVKIIKQ